MKKEYLLIDKSILPDYFELVLKVDDILRQEKLSVQAACDKVGISRSTYYKYKDKIIRPGVSFGYKATINILVSTDLANLSRIFNLFSDLKININKIFQDNPVNNYRNILLELDFKKANLDIDSLLSKIKDLDIIERVDLLRLE